MSTKANKSKKSFVYAFFQCQCGFSPLFDILTSPTTTTIEGCLIKAYGNTLNISGYNLEIGITTDIEATIKEEGEIVVSAKLFLDIVRRLPEEIVFIETDERMVTYIACGKVNYQIVGMSSVEYPDLPSFEQTDRTRQSLFTQVHFMKLRTVYSKLLPLTVTEWQFAVKM